MKKYLIPFFILSLGACQPGIVFEKYESLPEEVWHKYHAVEFLVPIPDSGQYRVSLCLRHTTDYEMTDLWCMVSTRSHATTQLADTVDLKITETDGHWIGTGGRIKTLEQAINLNPVNLPKGNVIFRIEPGMPLEEINGVKDIGIKIEK